jgi:hypothetical protein
MSYENYVCYYFHGDINLGRDKLEEMKFLVQQKDINLLARTLMLPIYIFQVPSSLVHWFIIVMAFVTYILLSALLSGIQGHFSPEDFSVTASYAFAVVLFEIVAIKLGCYLLGISGQGQFFFDLVAYGGYKFVGIVVTLLIRLAGLLGQREGSSKGWGRWIEWSVFIYCSLGLGFFMVSSPFGTTFNCSCDQ